MGTDAQRRAYRLSRRRYSCPKNVRGFGVDSGASQTRYRSDFKRTWVRLGERGRRDRLGARRGESLFSRNDSYEASERNQQIEFPVKDPKKWPRNVPNSLTNKTSARRWRRVELIQPAIPWQILVAPRMGMIMIGVQ